MGYFSKLQVIRRTSNDQKQYYLICPAPLAQALEMEKGKRSNGSLRTSRR